MMTKSQTYMCRICNFYSVPGTPGHVECREFLWSDGRECRLCELEACHRRGMKAKEARADADAAWKARQENE